MNQFSIAGKVAIITGASRGIGATIAATLAQAGAIVVLASRKPDRLEQVAARIRADGGEAVAMVCHAGHRDEVQRLVAATVAGFGRVDIAINNAATNVHRGSILETDEAMWDKMLQVNLKGYFWLAQAVMPYFRTQGYGKLVNIASIGGLTPGPYAGLYSITKAGVISLTQALAQEVGSENIQVNAIAPGLTQTEFSQPLWEDERIRQTIFARSGRYGAPQDVANAALFLASPASDYINGTVLVVDGGTMAAARF